MEKHKKREKRTWNSDAEKSKKKVSTSTPNLKSQTNSKSNETSTIISIFESAFQRFFRITKIDLYAQVMSKKPTAAPKKSSLENYRD
jgi:glutathionyl-hydroquinone reductase